MRRNRSSFVLLPLVLVAVGVLAYFTFRSTLQVDKLRQQSVLEATLGLATEKADRLDKRILEEDGVIFAIAEPATLPELAERWLPTAQRETPTVRAILVLDAQETIVAFASRAGGVSADEEAFRRLLVLQITADMDLANLGTDDIRHLHKEYAGKSYLVSYWTRPRGDRRYLVVAWHDIGRIVQDMLPPLMSELPRVDPSETDETDGRARVNVVDEQGRVIFGPPLRTGEFIVGVRFPNTLYGWSVQMAPAKSEEIANRVESRRVLELVMIGVSCSIVVIGSAMMLWAAEKERRISTLKSDFVANVSHELKTPLALIRMFGEMLQSGRVASEAKRQEYLDIIVSESERLSGLIENVLDFAKVERGRAPYEFSVGDVGQAVARAANVYRYRAEREGVELAVEIEPGLPPANIDERAIQLAVINLVDNALKYAPGGGVVTLRCAREGAFVVVRVIDRGPGVARDDRERIFERFVRGAGATAAASAAAASGAGPVRGSGIGLALVKHIAESHGGKAWVESEMGRGSTFAVRIPAIA